MYHILGIHGVSEQTTTGVTYLMKMLSKNELKLPVIDVNNSVTKVRIKHFNTLYMYIRLTSL